MSEDSPSSLEQSDQTTAGQLEMASSDPLHVQEVGQLDKEDTAKLQKQTPSTDRTCEAMEGDHKDVANKAEKEEPRTSKDYPSTSVSESSNQTDAETPDPTIFSRQPGGGMQYQLVFGMDDTGSEASLTSSPRSLDVNNPVIHYLSQHHCLPSPVVSSGSRDLGVKSGDLEALSHDLVSESRDNKEAEDTDSNDLKRKISTASTGDDVSSVYSSTTLKAGSVSEPDSKPTTTEKEREETATPDSEVKLEDITLRSQSPDSSRESPAQPKVHALNVLTSDSEAGDSPRYSPVPYLSGECEIERRNSSVTLYTCTCTMKSHVHCNWITVRLHWLLGKELWV